MRNLALLVLIGALALAACGGGSSAGDVRQSFVKTATLMANGDGAGACKRFTASVQRALASSSGASCQSAIEQLAQPLTTADRAGVARTAVTGVARSGDRATVRYTLGPGLRKLGFSGRSRLERVGGSWLIAPRNGR